MKEIALCKFDPIKYGHPMSVDIVDVESFRDYLWKNPAYVTNYYSILLITKGMERLEVDGKSELVRPGMVICSRPGELWHWEERSGQDGVYLYWTEDFLNSFFSDSRFIDRFTYFQMGRPSSFLYPDTKLFRRLLALFSQMREEIADKQLNDTQHILRAMLYETLMLLERGNNIPPAKGTDYRRDSYYINEFQRIARTHYKSEHQVEYYAGRLYITSNYLNKIVRQTLGISTKRYLSNILFDEAERLLKYTLLSINDIALELHLDTAYFIKIFKQRNTITPLQYRNNFIVDFDRKRNAPR